MGYKLFTSLLALLLLLDTYGCSFGKGKSESPEGYDFNHPEVIKLPSELDEISGLAYYAPDTCVFAIVDEAGLLYKIYLNNPKNIEKWKFAPRSDYEDLVLLDSTFYVLSSEGRIVSFKFIANDTLALHDQPLKSIGKGNEFEILYYDPKAARIVMMCKDCEMDKKKELSAFQFDPGSKNFEHPPLKLNVSRIAELVDKHKMKFKPSAAAISPLTGELFIISSINKMLVVADEGLHAKKVYHLSRKEFKQPEGLTFLPNGDLLISNESADNGAANILIFRYEKTIRKDK